MSHTSPVGLCLLPTSFELVRHRSRPQTPSIPRDWTTPHTRRHFRLDKRSAPVRPGATVDRMEAMDLNIHTMWGRTIRMSVEGDYCLGRIRWLLAASEGMPVDLLRFARKNQILADCCSVTELGHPPIAFLHVMMTIYVCFSTGKTFQLDVWDGDTIANVKDKIQDHENILAKNVEITFAGRWLQNQRTLSYYWIRQGATLHCSINIDIEVQSPQGHFYTITIATNETIGNLLQRIEASEEGIPANEQRVQILHAPWRR